tara:strand:- start:988 stop:1287 length:300 start_codon:yes stop_codon:yes gene_type:complete
MEDRPEYPLDIVINNKKLSRVVIDQHYKINHPEMNDKLIVELVRTQDGAILNIEEEKDGFQYFSIEPVEYEEKPYRLILLLCIHDDFVGVVNAFRVRRK